MRSMVRKMGNSSGIIVPKPLLAEIGAVAGDAVDIVTENDRLVISPIRRNVRAGWAEDSRTIAEAGDDRPVWPEFANEDDANLQW